MTQPSDFDPGSMVEWAKSMAEDSAERLSQTERLIAIRAVVAAFIEKDVIDAVDLEAEGASFEAAAQTLYMCLLIPMIFSQAYDEINAELVDQDRVRQFREQLKRSFEL